MNRFNGCMQLGDIFVFLFFPYLFNTQPLGYNTRTKKRGHYDSPLHHRNSTVDKDYTQMKFVRNCHTIHKINMWE